MPELPEVETVRLGLLPAIVGKRIDGVDLRRADLRRPFPAGFARRLRGRTVAGLTRRAKYLVAALDDGNSLVIHLGMSGSIRIEKGDVAQFPGRFRYLRSVDPRHDHVVLEMSDGTRITYNDPRRFGAMDLVRSAALPESPPLKGLGLEPLESDFTAAALARLLAGRASPIKAALLDQRLVAGLGNIYVSEALWRAGLSPLRPAGAVRAPEGKRLRHAIVRVLKDAIAAGGSSLRNHARTDGSPGAFQDQFDAYDRAGEPCRKAGCVGTIDRIVQNGRATYFCPTHQR